MVKLSDTDRKHFARWDKHIAKSAKKIRILGPLSWPPEAESEFLDAWERRAATLPTVPPPAVHHDAQRKHLQQAMDAVDEQHPIGRFLYRTAESYLDAAEMLEHAGTQRFVEISKRLYGHPTQPIAPGAPTHLEAAQQFLDVCPDLLPVTEDTLSTNEAAHWLQSQIDPLFPKALPVIIDDNLAALATAGSKRIRLRGGVRYTPLTLQQLLQHEALVHSATRRNGLRQPLLSCMGLSAPRTMVVQEGLATLAEMITDTMDLHRLRRIALRIVAIDAALNGADFIEVFTLFQAAGQSPSESFRSSARIFRGGDVRGGVVFTKDVVYLKGLMRTHTFLLKAIQQQRHELPTRLFAGRLTLHDAISLGPFFDSGALLGPQTVPQWIAQLPCLAAYLGWMAFSHRIPLQNLTLEDFKREED